MKTTAGEGEISFRSNTAAKLNFLFRSLRNNLNVNITFEIDLNMIID